MGNTSGSSYTGDAPDEDLVTAKPIQNPSTGQQKTNPPQLPTPVDVPSPTAQRATISGSSEPPNKSLPPPPLPAPMSPEVQKKITEIANLNISSQELSQTLKELDLPDTPEGDLSLMTLIYSHDDSLQQIRIHLPTYQVNDEGALISRYLDVVNEMKLNFAFKSAKSKEYVSNLQKSLFEAQRELNSKSAEKISVLDLIRLALAYYNRDFLIDPNSNSNLPTPIGAKSSIQSGADANLLNVASAGEIPEEWKVVFRQNIDTLKSAGVRRSYLDNRDIAELLYNILTNVEIGATQPPSRTLPLPTPTETNTNDNTLPLPVPTDTALPLPLPTPTETNATETPSLPLPDLPLPISLPDPSNTLPEPISNNDLPLPNNDNLPLPSFPVSLPDPIGNNDNQEKVSSDLPLPLPIENNTTTQQESQKSNEEVKDKPATKEIIPDPSPVSGGGLINASLLQGVKLKPTVTKVADTIPKKEESLADILKQALINNRVGLSAENDNTDDDDEWSF